MVQACHRPQQPLQNHPSRHLGGWATPWSAEEMLDGHHQRVDTPALSRTAHNGLLQKSLEEDLCWIVPHVPATTQSVKRLNWTQRWADRHDNKKVAILKCSFPAAEDHYWQRTWRRNFRVPLKEDPARLKTWALPFLLLYITVSVSIGKHQSGLLSHTRPLEYLDIMWLTFNIYSPFE